MEPTGRDGSTAYHDLYDLCAARFANVRMLGRGPFVGYTLATFDDGSDRVALDTRLIDGDPARPESFIAVASDSAVALDPMALVQVPDTLLETLREAGVRALREQLQEREQKLKEVEAASAERWVKIQRFEHGVKELEEENRKAREKVVRATKELEDERKLRQRVELEAQMSRRAPDLPKTPDLAPELQRAKDELARAEQASATARNEAAREIAAKESALAETRAAAHAAALALEAALAELAQLQGRPSPRWSQSSRRAAGARCRPSPPRRLTRRRASRGWSASSTRRRPPRQSSRPSSRPRSPSPRRRPYRPPTPRSSSPRGSSATG